MKRLGLLTIAIGLIVAAIAFPALGTENDPWTVTGSNRLHYGDLRLTVKWDNPEMVGDVFPNLQWIGFVDEGDDE